MHQKLTVNELKQLMKKLDIEAYLKAQKLEYKETGDSSNPQFVVHICPFCNNKNYKGNDHPNRLYIGANNANFRCYNCSEEGWFLKFAAKIEKLSFRNLFDKYLGEGIFEALPDILSEYLEEEDVKNNIIEPIKSIDLPEEFEQMFERPQGKFKDAYKYMIDRGMTAEGRKIYKALDIRYCDYYEYKTPSGKVHLIQDRIIFPIYWEGMFIGFQGRDITGEAFIKYYISEGLPKRRIIYNYENIQNADTIVICEGIIDLIKCYSHNPICVFGSYLSNEQLILLQKLPNLKKIIIGLDTDTKLSDPNKPDKPTKYEKLIEQLKPFWDILEIELPEGKDFGDCTFDEATKILSAAQQIKEKELTSILK